jgi:hypothetical protein
VCVTGSLATGTPTSAKTTMREEGSGARADAALGDVAGPTPGATTAASEHVDAPTLRGGEHVSMQYPMPLYAFP